MQRLKTRAQFQATMGGGIVARTPHFALHRLDLQAPDRIAPALPAAGPSRTPRPLFVGTDVWLGALVPKRWARRAVTRNTIKRQIYSLGTVFAAHWPAAAHVVRLRAGFDRVEFASATSPVLRRAVRAELDLLFSRMASTAANQAAT